MPIQITVSRDAARLERDIAAYEEMREGIVETIQSYAEEASHFEKILSQPNLSDKQRDDYKKKLDGNKLWHSEYEDHLKSAEMQLERLNSFAKEEQDVFVLKSGTTEEELKQIIKALEITHSNSHIENEQDKLFFDIFFKTTERLRDMKFPLEDDFEIPITTNEKKFAIAITSEAGITLMKTEAEERNNYNLENLAALTKIRKDSALPESGLNEHEKAFIDTICAKLEKAINKDIEQIAKGKIKVSNDEYQKNIERIVNTAANESDKVPKSSGCRGFLNKICQTFHLPSLFKTEATTTLAEKMNDMKEQMQGIQAGNVKPQDEQRELDNDDQQHLSM